MQQELYQYASSRSWRREAITRFKSLCKWAVNESHQSVLWGFLCCCHEMDTRFQSKAMWKDSALWRSCPCYGGGWVLALFKKKKRKVWIFKAYDRHRERLIDWECGDRDASTFQKLYDRLKRHQVLFYCADHWKGFNKIISQERLYQGKDKTIAIERNNCQQRHWFARFKRKSIVVSKSMEMIEATMRIFAAVHINQTLNLNFNILG